MLPPAEFGPSWKPVIYTADDAAGDTAKPESAGATVHVEARSILVLQAAAE